MTMTDFEGVPTDLMVKVKYVPSVTYDGPKLTEVDAAGGLDLTMFLRTFNPQPTQNTGEAPPKLGRGINLPRLGKLALEALELRYPESPQGDEAERVNEARTLLVSGLTGTIVVRRGQDQFDDFAVGDAVDLWPGRFGQQIPVNSGDDEFAEHEILQLFAPERTPRYGVRLVA